MAEARYGMADCKATRKVICYRIKNPNLEIEELNSSYEQFDLDTAKSLDDAVCKLQLKTGSYTVIPIYSKRVWDASSTSSDSATKSIVCGKQFHEQRLSFHLIEEAISLKYFKDVEDVKSRKINSGWWLWTVIRDCFKCCKQESSRCRVIFSNDLQLEGSSGNNDKQTDFRKADTIICLENWQPIPEDGDLYVKGVCTEITSHINFRRSVPHIKSIDWIHTRLNAMGDGSKTSSTVSTTKWKPMFEDTYEYLLSRPASELSIESNTNSEELIVEGFGSNIFVLCENNVLLFPTKQSLKGLGQQIAEKALQASAFDNLTIINRAPSKEDLFSAKEVILASASRGIFPVVRVNDRIIGEGKPGSFFISWRKAYNKAMDELCTAL